MISRLKKSISCILMMFILLSGIRLQAADSYMEQARVLYELGLYLGTSTECFMPDLDFPVNRETAAVFLVRLMGEKSSALTMTANQIDKALGPYADSDTISAWARPYVAYGVRLGLFPDITGNFILPKGPVDGKTFTAMLLKYMGYGLSESQWTISSYVNSYLGGITPGDAKYLNDKILTRNDMVGIVWESLDIRLLNGSTLLKCVMDKNGIPLTKLTSIGFQYKNGVLTAPVFGVSSLSGGDESPGTGDGPQYSGTYGVPDGYRVVHYPDGSVYEGYVLNGRREGEGRFVRSDGFVYSGGWTNDSMNGTGKMIWPNGDNYSGDVVYGAFQGNGTMIWASGDSYSGQWYEGEFHGKGKLLWSSGNYYDGEWYMGEFQGYGVFHWANGESYEGFWQDGKKHGTGTYTRPDKTVQTGIWQNDIYMGKY